MKNVFFSPSVLLGVLFLILSLGLRNQITAQPTNETEIYFVPFSHLDFFWGGTREECVSRGNRIIAKAIHLANESPRFRFLLEDNVFVANFMDSHKGSPETEELRRLVKEGRIEISPKWAGIFQGLPDGEVHVRNMVIGKRYAQDMFGVDAQVAHLGDLPGYTPQFPQILHGSRVPYAVITRMGPADKSVFYWTSPDGSKALAWNALSGYGWGTFLTSENRTLAEKKERFLSDLAAVQKTTHGPIMMHWGIDLWSPPDNLVSTVEDFFKEVPAKLTISTPSDFFHRLEKTPSIPDVSGEIPSSWPNIVSSLVHIWPGIIPATNTLLAAEKFSTVNYALGYADYPQEEFDFLWKKLVESMDHNHDGQGGIIGDNRKIEYQQLSVNQGGEILRDMLRNIAERVEIPIKESFPIVVFNSQGWKRNDIVMAHLTLYGNVGPYDIDNFRKGMQLLDEEGNAIPFHVEEWSENISRALKLVFVARDVPSLGYKTFYLVASEKTEELSKPSIIKLDSENDRREPRRALGSDMIENKYYKVSVDRATGRVTLFDKEINRDVCPNMEVAALEERGGNYIGKEPLSGRNFISLINEINIVENNQVRTVIQIKSQVADIPVEQKLILYNDLKRLDIENTVEWRPQVPRFIRIHQIFPKAWEQAAVNYGIPFGANSAGNLMPNAETKRNDEITNESWKASRHVHDWIHVGNGQEGLTISTDHQQIRLAEDAIYAEMVRGTRYVSVKVKREDQITSMNYPPAGTYVFRYSLSSGTGDWKMAKSYQSGMDLTNPLVPIAVADDITKKSLPPSQSFLNVQSENVILSAFKKADLDRQLVVRMYEIEGKMVDTPIDILGKKTAFREVNLLEEETGPANQSTLHMDPFSIRTIKLNFKKGKY